MENFAKFESFITDIRIYLKEIHGNHHLPEELLGVGHNLIQKVSNIFEEQNIAGYWLEIIKFYKIDSKYAIESMNILTKADRYLGNLYETNHELLPQEYNHMEYIKMITKSFIDVVIQLLSTVDRNIIGNIMKHMNREVLHAIGLMICHGDYQPYWNSFLEILYCPTLLEILSSLHRVPLISKSSSNIDSINLIYLFVGLIIRQVSAVTTGSSSLEVNSSTTETLVQSLIPFLTHKFSTPRMGQSIASNILDPPAVLLACYRVGLIWSERVYVNQGNIESQTYTTSIILTFLSKMTKDHLISLPTQLTSSSEDSVSQTLLSVLSRGVSTHLDSPSTLSRINGMRVAESLSRVMISENSDNSRNNVIQFEELKKYCEDKDGYMILKEKNHEPPTVQLEKLNLEPTISENISNRVSDQDSDSDDEFQSYFMKERMEVVSHQDVENSDEVINTKIQEIEMKEEPIKLLRYLRDCLAKLQYTDSSNPDGLYANHRVALLSIPLIVQNKPADGRDLAPPLMRELLRLSNSFNMEKFDDLRNTASDCLLFAYPKEVTPIITSAVTSETMTLGSKLEVLALMIRGAYHLSGLVADTNSPSSQKHTSMIEGRNLRGEILDVEPPLQNSSESKTIVKRPLRLASLKKRTTYFRNNFPLCAETFFATVYKSLHDSLTEIYSAKESPDCDPGIYILYPAQSLFALGAFTRCAINTPIQKKLATTLLPFAFQLRDVPSLHIRRSAMSALFDATESIINCFHASHQPQVMSQEHMFGTLDYALNIFREEDKFNNSLSPLLIEIINWVSARVHEEIDRDCRIYQLEILRLALSCFESSNARS